jgi:hypothetical protein
MAYNVSLAIVYYDAVIPSTWRSATNHGNEASRDRERYEVTYLALIFWKNNSNRRLDAVICRFQPA